MKDKININKGPFYIAFSILIFCLKWLNLVELMKIGTQKLVKKKDKKIVANWTIDIFNLLKFVFIFICLFCQWKSVIILGVVLYLIFFNLYTYFYHHIWDKSEDNTEHGQKRRFIMLMLSFIFSNLAFGVLYGNFLFDQFKLIEPGTEIFSPVVFSFLNSFTADYAWFEPKTELAEVVKLIQIGVTFIFLTIILSVSIPERADN